MLSIRSEVKKGEKPSEAKANGDESREEYYSKLMQALIKRELPKVLSGYKNVSFYTYFLKSSD